MFRKLIMAVLALTGLVTTLPVGAQAGVQVVCPDGQVIENGVEIIVNMRPGFTYYATAIGIDGFDPVLAVSDQNGVSLCADDESAAFSYSVDLPTTGFVPASRFSSQVPFFHDFDGFHDISVIVGGFGNASGEFVVLLEGMAVTSADGTGPGSGDPFSLHITPNVTASGVPITTYMISVTSGLDPFLKVVNGDGETFAFDDGTFFACDDSGDANLCWGESHNLSGSYISRTAGRQLPGGSLDAMMIVPIEELGMGPDDDAYLNWKMSSSGNRSQGDYVVVYHLGTASVGGAAPVSGGELRQWASAADGTSQYGSSGWSFAQATGEPDTADCGDRTTAWASSSSRGVDSLTLTFDAAVIPTQINIYQTYNPGSIIAVEVANSSTGESFSLSDSADPPGNTPCPGVFSLDVLGAETPVDTVTIYLDQTIGGSWNEIDAVELVGIPG
jgi:hypothetical protein